MTLAPTPVVVPIAGLSDGETRAGPDLAAIPDNLAP